VKKGIYYWFSANGTSHRDNLQLVKAAGFDGIELPALESIAEVEEIAGLAREVGLEISSVMAGTHWQFPLSSTDEQIRIKGIEGIEHALKVAQAAGTDAVLVVPGLVDANTSYAAAHELSGKSLRELLPVAQDLGVMMLLENVWNKFLLSPLETREFIDSFASPYVQAYFDVGNILLYGFPHQWIEILGERVKRVHIKDFSVGTRQFVGLLQGDVDYPRVVNALRGIGYDSFLTAELSPYKQFVERFLSDTAGQIEAIIAS
jgi:L-ribulose-5-phosphate 3-epimerase